MQIPLSWADFKLMIAMITVILVITNELLNPRLGKNRIYINRRRFQNVTYMFVVLFGLVFITNLLLIIIVG